MSAALHSAPPTAPAASAARRAGRQPRRCPAAALASAAAAAAAAAAPHPDRLSRSRAATKPAATAPAAAPAADLAGLFAAHAPATTGPQSPEQLNARFAVQGFVEFARGEGGLTLALLHHPCGHTVEVYLQGATVTRWLDGARRDFLMPRPDATFRRGAAIDSGVPLSFPQWREVPASGSGVGGASPMPAGGFASRLEWEVVEANVSFSAPRTGMSREELEVECARRAGRGEDFGLLPAADDGGASSSSSSPSSLLPPDVEPYVVLRLRDSAATRAAGYPHAFELLYRVSLSYSDEGLDLSQPAQQALAGAAAERQLLAAARADGHDLEADVAAADRAARDGDEPPFEAGSPRAEAVRLLRAARAARRAGRSLAADPRGGDPPLPSAAAAKRADADDDAPGGAPGAVATASAVTSASALIGMEVNRAAVMPDAAAEGEPPVQLRLSLYARNNADGQASGSGAAPRAAASAALKRALAAGKTQQQAEQDARAAYESVEAAEKAASGGGGGSSAAAAAADATMAFEIALLPHFATIDQRSPQGRAFVRARGLGGLRALDWAPPRVPGTDLAQEQAMRMRGQARLSLVKEDYLQFGARPLDVAASAAHAADVRLCPGDRSHYEFVQRGGMRDAIVRHPGQDALEAGLGASPSAARRAAYERHCAALGAGRVVAPVRLAPGEDWRGELVVRRHARYWAPAAWEMAGEAAGGAREPVPPLVIDPRMADK